jgi:hypothetical protein
VKSSFRRDRSRACCRCSSRINANSEYSIQCKSARPRLSAARHLIDLRYAKRLSNASERHVISRTFATASTPTLLRSLFIQAVRQQTRRARRTPTGCHLPLIGFGVRFLSSSIAEKHAEPLLPVPFERIGVRPIERFCGQAYRLPRNFQNRK